MSKRRPQKTNGRMHDLPQSRGKSSTAPGFYDKYHQTMMYTINVSQPILDVVTRLTTDFDFRVKVAKLLNK